MVWDQVFTNGDVSLSIADSDSDSDSDGIPGHKIAEGPFVGFSLAYDFLSPSAPSINVSMVVQSGNSECKESNGGSTYNLGANVVVTGDTTVTGVEWFMDGVSVSTGDSIALLIPLGGHTVEVVATNSAGQSDSDTRTFNVYDYTAPEVVISFTDGQTGEVITSITTDRVSYVTPVIVVTDACDPSPTVEAVASPVFEVVSGESVIKIKGKSGAIEMTTTGLEVRATAIDSEGHSKTVSSVLPIQ